MIFLVYYWNCNWCDAVFIVQLKCVIYSVLYREHNAFSQCCFTDSQPPATLKQRWVKVSYLRDVVPLFTALTVCEFITKWRRHTARKLRYSIQEFTFPIPEICRSINPQSYAPGAIYDVITVVHPDISMWYVMTDPPFLDSRFHKHEMGSGFVMLMPSSYLLKCRAHVVVGLWIVSE